MLSGNPGFNCMDILKVTLVPEAFSEDNAILRKERTPSKFFPEKLLKPKLKDIVPNIFL